MKIPENNNYPIVPGRALVTKGSTDERIKYLQGLAVETEYIQQSNLLLTQIGRNIESYIGSVELPLGLAGPLRYNNSDGFEMVHAATASLEGALVSSINRGAKAVSRSGGFDATVIHQKMIRCPMFIFSNESECATFSRWIIDHTPELKREAERHSNHAKLIEITPVITGNSVHIYFIYTTGDASGQNMTTTCTWYAILMARELFYSKTQIEPVLFVIEGNGAADKKVSKGNILRGRGIHVKAECELEEKIIKQVLRTSSAQLLMCYESSLKIAEKEGMVGYNINVSNAIAGIFAATGQDLGSLHESSSGVLHIESTPNGLHFSLTLPNLVVGTIGGGTHLQKQKEILEMMGCYGNGKVNRFAEIISGFALALETSTFAAIVGGQFAKAHEKMGRNKPVNWLTRSEINVPFLQSCLKFLVNGESFNQLRILSEPPCENGIIISLTNKINRKLTGFVALELSRETGEHDHKQLILMKSKPLDEEVMKGLHLMASAVAPTLATLIYKYRECLEYHLCHKKELVINELLQKTSFRCMPALYGTFTDWEREIYLLFTELLDYDQMSIINSENHPELWTSGCINTAITDITKVHMRFMNQGSDIPAEIPLFEPWKATELYEEMAEIIETEYSESKWAQKITQVKSFINVMKDEHDHLRLSKTLIHNDFNARNVGIRSDGRSCIYDWELAIVHFPHRDIIEFLSFTLSENFTNEEFWSHIYYHTHLHNPKDEKRWRDGYVYCLKEYLITRVSFYLTGRIVLDFAFTERIVSNTFRMLEILENRK